MNSEKTTFGKKLLVILPLITLAVLLLLIAVSLFSFGYVEAILHGPKIVMSLSASNGNFEAYVEELPSIDPPNQSLFVENSNKRNFMHIADLSEDVDSIKEIQWSPDSEIVIFHSHHYLTATRVKDWRTVRIYLGKEWRRSRPQRHHTTFSSGGVQQTVETIKFSKSGSFSYRLKGSNNFPTVSI